jgi:DNA-binding GntR family transcriptional regulator
MTASTVPEPRARPRPLRDQVYDQLLTLLAAGEFCAGDHLPERALSERFGVSRGPVRDAIRLLERDGWVSLRAGRGSFVRTLTDAEVSDVYEARMVVESASARLAAIRVPSTGCPELLAIVAEAEALLPVRDASAKLSQLTMRFHHEVSELSGNSFLREFSQRISVMSHRIVVPLVPRIAPQAWREHAAIARAIGAGDALQAENLMRDHLMWSRRVYRQTGASS